MCKKLGILMLAGVAALSLFTFTRVGSYVSTAWDKASNCAHDQVPAEFEIERLKHEIKQIAPDMKQHRRALATEIVAVKNLRSQIEYNRANLAKQKESLVQLANDIESGETQVVYGSRVYSLARIKEKLSRDLASYKRGQAELEARVKLLDAKERALDVARDQVDAMMDQKRELEIQVAELEAELKTVRLAQTKSQFQVDDTRLSEIKQSISALRNRLSIEKVELELEGEYNSDPINPKEARPAADVAREVLDYFEK